jgi:hypothetical protein
LKLPSFLFDFSKNICNNYIKMLNTGGLLQGAGITSEQVEYRQGIINGKEAKRG